MRGCAPKRERNGICRARLAHNESMVRMAGAPAVRAIASRADPRHARPLRQLEGRALVRLGRHVATDRTLQAGENPVAHLRRRLVGEVIATISSGSATTASRRR